MELEQAVVRVCGDVPQVLAERHVDQSDAQRVFRRYLRLFFQVEPRRDRENAHGRRLEERWGDEQRAESVHHGHHVIFCRGTHQGNQCVQGWNLWIWHRIENAEERMKDRRGLCDV